MGVDCWGTVTGVAGKEEQERADISDPQLEGAGSGALVRESIIGGRTWFGIDQSEKKNWPAVIGAPTE